MSGNRDPRLNLDWVSVRYRSVVMLVVAVVGVTGAGWMVWSHFAGRGSPQALASREISAAESLYREASTYGKTPEAAPIREKARENLAESRTLFNGERFEEARIKAILSRNNSQKIIDIARSGETIRSEARFYRVSGEVKVKQAGSLLWDPADPEAALRVGDAELPAGSYYLTIEKTAENAFVLAFNDPAKIRKKKLDAYMAHLTKGGIEVEMMHKINIFTC